MAHNDKTYFEQIILLPEGKKILKQLRAKGFIKASQEEMEPIYYRGLVTKNLIWDSATDTDIWDGTFILSDTGKLYLEFLRENRKKTIINWSINLSVALISAIFGSVITLFIQQALIQ